MRHLFDIDKRATFEQLVKLVLAFHHMAFGEQQFALFVAHTPSQGPAQTHLGAR